ASSRPKPATTASITTAASSSTADQQASGGRSSASRSFPGTPPESPNARPRTLPPGSTGPRCQRQAMIRLAVITGQPYLAAGDPLRAELAGLIGRVVVSRWRPDGVGPGVGVEEHRHLPVRA